MRLSGRKAVSFLLALCLALGAAAPVQVFAEQGEHSDQETSTPSAPSVIEKGSAAASRALAPDGGTLFLEADTVQPYTASQDPYIYFTAYNEFYTLTESESMELLRAEREDGTALAWDALILPGETVYIRAVPRSEYSVSSISYSGGSVPLADMSKTADGRFRFTMPEDDVTVHVYLTYAPGCTASVTASNASVQFLDGAGLYRSGSSVAFTVSPDSDFRVTEVAVVAASGAAVPLTLGADSVYRFTMPSENVTVHVMTAREYAVVPGGVVTDYVSLMAALGGEINATLVQAAAPMSPSGVLLKRRLVLEDTLVFRGGDLTLGGARHDLTAPDGKHAIVVEEGAALTLCSELLLSSDGEAKSEAPSVVSVSGGLLNLTGCSVYGSAATQDAVALSGGALLVRDAPSDTYVCGGGTGCGLNISGGRAVILGGNIAGGSGVSGGGDGIRITDGALEMRSGYLNPGYPGGVSLRVIGSPRVTLFGGHVWCCTSWDDAAQTNSITAPSVVLPQGRKLSDLLAEDHSIMPNLNDAGQTVAEALAASEVMCAFEVVGSTAAALYAPMLPTHVDKDTVQVAFLSPPPAGSSVIVALYDENGRFLECGVTAVDPMSSSATLNMSGKSAEARSAGVFLLSAEGLPICGAAETALDD